MADGYARATGKVGVCIGTSGPGATNMVTGIATAMMDSVPMVVLTGQVPTYMIGKDAFQETDTTGITMPITKHNYLVMDVKDLARVVREAFHIARTGRPGPVLIDIPKDVTTNVCDFEYPEKIALPGFKPKMQGHINPVRRAAQPARRVAAAPDPGRARDHPVRGLRRAARAGGEDPHPGDHHPAGHLRLPRDAPPVLRLAGDARHVLLQHGHLQLRHHPGRGDAHGRPGHRAAQRLRPPRPDHPRGHRPGRAGEERANGGEDRGRRQGRAAAVWSRK